MSGFRTIVINKRAKLESLLGMLIIRSDKEERVYISEIETLIIESTAVAVTAALIVDLTAAGVNIIFCDRRHFPTSIFTPTHSHHSCSKNIREQINWDKDIQLTCWKKIVQEKIRQQSFALTVINKPKPASALSAMIDKVRDGDPDNFEGMAARLYFVNMFGEDFSRNTLRIENSALNYGYTLILSSFVREIVASGYITEIGIWHRGAENPYNLASDLMEPFRIIADIIVYEMPLNEEANFKHYMLKVLSSQIEIDGDRQSFVYAIRIYLRKIFRFLNGETDNIFSINIVRDSQNEL